MEDQGSAIHLHWWHQQGSGEELKQSQKMKQTKIALKRRFKNQLVIESTTHKIRTEPIH